MHNEPRHEKTNNVISKHTVHSDTTNAERSSKCGYKQYWGGGGGGEGEYLLSLIVTIEAELIFVRHTMKKDITLQMFTQNPVLEIPFIR